MWCGVVTLFPEQIRQMSGVGVTGRAIEMGIMQISVWDLRKFADNKHQNVDDKSYGGGPGMVLQVAPLRAAINAAKEAAPKKPRVIYLTPSGRLLNQAKVRQCVSDAQPLILVAGRYEGIDQRIVEQDIDEELSIGDYVLSGGELGACVFIDAMTRLLPGVLGDEQSSEEDAFSAFSPWCLDYPHYTRPREVDGQKVPEVLLTGNHDEIARWRRKQALGLTWKNRPDLLANITLDEKDKILLNEYRFET